MSLILRTIIRRYHAQLSPRPDGATHVRDASNVVHVLTERDPVNGMRVVTCNGMYVVTCGGSLGEGPEFMALFRQEGSLQAEAISTWDPVDCMACLARRTP